MTPGPLVHGMGTELVAPDWAPLTDEEVRLVLCHYPGHLSGRPSGTRRTGVGDAGDTGDTGDEAEIIQTGIAWPSPRPMSAAALVRWGGTTVFVKRHDRRVRTPAQLAAEHAFARHLRSHGVPVPAVLHTMHGESSLALDGWVYEVHEGAPGLDLYRDAMSWTPFASLGHAWAAGAALARLHRAAATFGRPARPFAPLVNSCEVITARDPVERVAHLVAQRPGLARYLERRPWADDLGRHHLPAVRRAAPLVRTLPPQWGHGDWHPSNLTWASAEPDAEVVAVLDLGLANRTFAVHDLATALERSTVSWLDLAGTGQAEADLDAVTALLDGYVATRRPSQQELAALAEVLPVVHLDYALSEVEYFVDVVGSAANADLCYDTYLIGHARWFEGPSGSALVDLLRRRALSHR
jgi:Ser/Thr protein kinase RdoA (MazF antagonist)